MRITNKVIQNNSLNNINTNKLLQDKLSQQMATEKKVNRPSDDPIVAIRALRLRTNVNQITQYYEKNVPDAESWLSVTESALSSMSEVVTDMYEQCTKGSNEKLTSSDRETILTALKALRDEVYSTGNADYAGRYIFTGYRTDSTLTFTDATTQEYKIIEQLQNSKIDSVTYVETDKILDINESNFTSDDVDGTAGADPDGGLAGIKDTIVTTTDVHRIRLSYADVDEAVPNIKVVRVDADGKAEYDADGNVIYDDLIPAANYTVASIHDKPSPYADISNNPDGAILIKETGELLLGENVYNKLMALKDDPTTSADEGEFRVEYQKTEWEKGDLKPEHYFACTAVNAQDPTKNIEYNQSYLEGIEEKQAIEYDVGLNQTIRVNTTADEVFSHDISRDVEDMIKAMEDTVAMEKQVAKLTKMLEEQTDPAKKEIIEDQLAAAEKAFTFLKENTQLLFEHGITKMQKHLDAVNYAVTQNGTRGQKLDLIANRLMSQKTNFETLKSENEDIDIADVSIKLSSAELTYNAALMATGKILQTNLMNFI